MGHTASPSLIALELTGNGFLEGPSFRRGLATSCVLHAIILLMAFSLQFHPKLDAPFRTIDVALISLPAQPQTGRAKKAVAPPPKKIKRSQPKSKPVENTLPPLPTDTASERLSESFGGALSSIVVPQKRQSMAPSTPAQKGDSVPPKDQTPLFEKLQLPSAPPKISRPSPLQASKRVKIPQTPPPPIQKTQPTPVETKAQPTPSPSPVAKVEPVMKSVPALPSLSEVAPFKKRKQEITPDKAVSPHNIEDSIKRTIPSVPSPVPARKIQRKAKTRTPQKVQQSAVPQISAPQLSAVPPTPPLTENPRSKPLLPETPPPPKMSDTVKQLMEGLKSKTRKPTPSSVAPPKTLPPPTTIPTQPEPTELDHRIAKLSIPQVAPVESIKKHLQLLEVQPTPGAPKSASGPSPGESRYLAMVEDAIDRQWVAPPLLLTDPLVVLKFRIDQSGKISQIQMDQSSGNGHYDAAAKRAIHAVNPLPPFPKDLKKSSLVVLYRFIKD